MKKTVVTGILAAALLLSAVPGAGAALTETPLTRGEFITCLYQADLDRQESGKGATDPPPCDVMGEMTAVYLRYADVSLDSELAVPAAWASFCGIAAYWDNKDINFAPERKITREEAALMLLRYAQSLGYAPHCWRQEVLPEDAGEISPWAAGATYWALENGIFSRSGSGDAQARALVTHSDLEGALVSLEESLVDEPINRGYFAYLIYQAFNEYYDEILEHWERLSESQSEHSAIQAFALSTSVETESEEEEIVGPPMEGGIPLPTDATDQYFPATSYVGRYAEPYILLFEPSKVLTVGDASVLLWELARWISLSDVDSGQPVPDDSLERMTTAMEWASKRGLIPTNCTVDTELFPEEGQQIVSRLLQQVRKEI